MTSKRRWHRCLLLLDRIALWSHLSAAPYLSRRRFKSVYGPIIRLEITTVQQFQINANNATVAAAMAKVKALTGVEVNLKQFHPEQKNDEKQRKSKTKY